MHRAVVTCHVGRQKKTRQKQICTKKTEGERVWRASNKNSRNFRYINLHNQSVTRIGLVSKRRATVRFRILGGRAERKVDQEEVVEGKGKEKKKFVRI